MLCAGMDELEHGAVENAENDNEDEIRSGDIIIDVNRKQVSSINDVKKALEKAKNIRTCIY